MEHRWSGWPGAWCIDCGVEDPREIALAEGQWEGDGQGGIRLTVDVASRMECRETGSGRFDPHKAK